MRSWAKMAVARLHRFLSLSPEGAVFFYALALVHVAMKMLLGLRMVFEDGYGFRSMLAPPQSVVFAGADILACFAFARLLDFVPGPRGRRVLHTLLLPLLFLFLTTNFFLHGYFKAFLNRGLLAFNGAGATEIADYTRAGFDPYTGAFVAILGATFLGLALGYRRFTGHRWATRPRPAIAVLALGGASLAYAGPFSAGQSGWLTPTPLVVFTESYVRTARALRPTASAEQVRAFHAPDHLLYGEADTSLSVAVEKKPKANVLFLLIESLPFEQTCLGETPGGMPVLGELAEDGVTFTNFRTVFPATSRSFLTYHCGIYPTAGLATSTRYAPDYRCDSLLALLHRAGYRTGFFTAPMFTYDNMHRSSLRHEYDVYEDMLSLRPRAKKNAVDAPAVEEEVVAEAVFDFMAADREAPFFATYFLFWNHAPYRLPFEDIGHLSDLERYRRTLQYLDGVLRDLLARARTAGLLENTIVVAAADHGEGFALHHENTNHVGHIYEDDVRVPLVIHVPGLGHHVTARPASNVDFAPTLAALLGLAPEASWQGQDLLSPSYVARPTLLFGRASFVTEGLVDGNWKYIAYPEEGRELLFDLRDDPHEAKDLARTRPDQVTAYRRLVGDWISVADALAWDIHARGERRPLPAQ